MKKGKLLGITLCLLYLIPVLALAQKVDFAIEGKLSKAETASYIYLQYSSDDKRIIDSVKINEGQFEFKGSVSAITLANLFFKSERGRGDGLEIYLDNGIVQIKGENLSNVEIMGSRINEQNVQLKKMLQPLNEEWSKASQAFNALPEDQKKNGSAGWKETEKKFDELNARMRNVRREFIKNNPHSIVSLNALSIAYGPEFTPAEVEPVFNEFPDNLKLSKTGVQIKSKIDGMRRSAVGVAAPDFAKKNPEGSLVKLSDFKGKVVLIDFWGSWCGPCRASHPHLKEVYEKYKSKGLEILAVSNERKPELEEAKKAWIKAIQDDKITRPQVLNDEDIATVDVPKLYAISGYPTKVLIDKDGKVIYRLLGNVDGLDDKLKEIFGE